MEFLNPFNSIWALCGLIAWGLDYYKVFSGESLVLPTNLNGKRFSFLKGILFVLGVFSWILIAIAVTGPRKPVGVAKNPVKANDIFFVVDVSLSMKANDFKPDRLESAKRKIEEFVNLRPTDRIGLIIFSEKVFTLLPLSTDLELIKDTIRTIDIGFLGSGTNIGDAIALAVGRAAQSASENQVIILLTDGVSNVGLTTPLQAAKEAKKQNIKIYSIGIGGNGDAKIPVGKDMLGRVRYQVIPGGSFDTKTLEEMSDLTNGKFYRAQDEQALRTVLSDIEKLEKKDIDVSQRTIYKELYYQFLFWGIILFLLTEILRRVWLREGV